MNRRDFLSDLGRLSILCAGIPNVWRVTALPILGDDPFTLGVASGDPTPMGAVIWTRLAPDLFDPDSGMGGQRTVVSWEVAEDEAFARVVQRGRYTAAPELGFSVHVDVPGLQAGRAYFYRFTIPAGSSPVGRLRTAPAEGATTPLRLAFASCQHYEEGLFTAYDHLARETPDLVAHLGDYIYEYAAVDARVRKHATTEIRTLDDYRVRYAQTKSDPALQAAHARGAVDRHVGRSRGRQQLRGTHRRERDGVRRPDARSAARTPIRHGGSTCRCACRARGAGRTSTSRARSTGAALARFWVLDERQYRSDQACGDGNQLVPCGDWADPGADPARRRAGEVAVRRSRRVHRALAGAGESGPHRAVRQRARRAIAALSMDQWSGYPAALDRLSRAIAQRAPNRTIAITGDIHSNWVNELRSSYDGAGGAVVGAEFVGTSISSGGDGADVGGGWNDKTRAENPFCKWHNARRGYVTCEFTADECRAHYRTVPFVTKIGAPIETASSWLVQRGKPGLQKI